MVTQASHNELVSEFLREANDDFVGLWEIVHVLERQIGDARALRDQTLDVARELLARGLLAGGLSSSDDDFHPWPDQRPDAVIARIRSEWIALGRTPNIGDIVWFSRPDQA